MEPGPSLSHDVLGSHDTLRFGLPTFKSDAVSSHPVQLIQEQNRKYHENTKLYLLGKVHGGALPFQMQFEKQILSKFRRPSGLIPSSMLGLESLTGTLDEIGIEDSFGSPLESDSFVPVDLHHSMEVRLGLSQGPVQRSLF